METRSLASQLTSNNNKLVGYAAVFNRPTKITENGRTFTEVIRPGAFRSLSKRDVLATFNHDPANLLGRTSSGTLTIQEDSKGLRFEVDLPQSANHLKELVSRGDVSGASFSFNVNKGGDRWSDNVRELTDVTVFELGPV